MERLLGERTASELFNKFNLKNFLYNYKMAGDNCSKCTQNRSEGYVIVRQNKRTNRPFYACSNTNCDWTSSIN